MDDKVALANSMNLLGIPPFSDSSFSLQRIRFFDTAPRKMNVVIVLMESMCTYKMGDYHGQVLATVMDSLSKRSIYFSNFFSSGIHTFNGIFSSLYGHPALYKQQPLKYNTPKKFYGIPGALKDNGYNTMYFTTHDEQFDNMGGFLQYNGFDKIISEKDYPSGHSLSTLGVPDHYMFEYSMNILDEAAKDKKPFLAVMLTTSDHGPWVIPTDIPFKPKSSGEKERATEYADWSIGQLLKNAQTKPWYNHTLFVFLGDHGFSVSSTYDMPLSYNHVPCIFYNPNVIDSNRVIKNFG
jgi:phosphoglycerol transferase MdoB-like AlkP superfamily enzyme